MVAGIVAGDPAGIAAAYDHYALPLYAYCRSLLNEPTDAADAVQDTFVVAASKLAGLRDPDRLRPWLYAVARNECRRWLRGRAGPASAEDAEERADETAVFSTAALEQAQLRKTVQVALDGLNPGQREVIELSLRHEFYGADLADALGVPLNQAHALASRARTQFETALGALLVARSGQGSCSELAEMLEGWDGHLTALLRKQVKRHIERCEVCGERRRRDLSPAALLDLLPAAVLPAGLRLQVLGLVADTRPDAVAYRAEVDQEAEPFARSGFPVPLDPLTPVRGPGTFMPAAGAAVAAIAVLGGGIMFTADVVHHHPSPRTEMAAAGPPALPSASAAPAAATPAPSKSARAKSVQQASQAGFGPTFGVVVTPSITKKATKPPVKSTKKATPPPTTPPPTTPPPTTPPPTTPPPAGTSSSTSVSLNLGLDPASIPLLSGTGVVVTTVVFTPSPAGVPGAAAV